MSDRSLWKPNFTSHYLETADSEWHHFISFHSLGFSKPINLSASFSTSNGRSAGTTALMSSKPSRTISIAIQVNQRTWVLCLQGSKIFEVIVLGFYILWGWIFNIQQFTCQFRVCWVHISLLTPFTTQKPPLLNSCKTQWFQRSSFGVWICKAVDAMWYNMYIDCRHKGSWNAKQPV